MVLGRLGFVISILSLEQKLLEPLYLTIRCIDSALSFKGFVVREIGRIKDIKALICALNTL
jgi:hypothetical protein